MIDDVHLLILKKNKRNKMKPLTVNGLEEICKEITNKDSPVLLSFFKDDQEIWTKNNTSRCRGS